MGNMLFEVTPLYNGAPITVRMSSAFADASGTQLNGYQWLPLIVQQPTREVTLSSDGVLDTVTISHGSIGFWMSPDFNNEAWSGYEWTNATCNIYVGNPGDPFASYVPYMLGGTVSSLSRDGINASLELLGPEATLNTPLLTQEYQGTGGIEGPASLKGKLKPRVFGSAQSVESVLVDSASWIYQIDGYGGVATIPAVYEFAQALDNAKNKGDVASYSALVALTLVPGEWATCNAQGLFRLGATPKNKVSADVVAGGGTVGGIVRKLLSLAGVPTGRIGDFSAWTQAFSLYQTDQANIGDLARDALYQAGGYLIPDGSGIWQAGDYFAAKAPLTVSTDGTLPLVTEVREVNAAAPVYKVRIGFNRCWGVHSDSDVSPALAEVSDANVANAAAIEAAVEDAAQAQADAAAASARLNAIEADGILDRSEKAQVVQMLQNETQQVTALVNQGSTFNVTAERDAYNADYMALNAYMVGLSPAYTDLTQNTPIDRTVFDSKWRNYFVSKQAFTNALTGKAATTSTWSGVSGTGKPENYATVGAPAGTNVAGQDASALVADTANAKGNAQTAINALKNTDGTIITAQSLMAADATLTANVTTARNEAAAAKTEGTTARQEAAQVRTDLVPTITAAKAEGTTARQEAAKVRTDLVPTITQAQTDANAAKTSAATARSDLADEVTRAKGAEGAISTNVANLKTTVDGHTTTISDNFTTLTNKDTALANRSTLLESASSGGGSLNANSSFAVWPDGQALPTKWTNWEGPAGWSLTRVASGRPTSPYAARIYAPANSDCGIAQWWNDAANQVPMNPGWYVLEADVSLESGTWNGAGMSIQGVYNFHFATTPDNAGIVSATQTGNRRFSVIVQATQEGLVNWHPMTNWSSFGARDAKTLTWFRAAVRPASDAEIKAQKADLSLNTPGTGVVARLGTEETTRSNADSALANRATTLEGSVNNGTTGLAATYAKVSTEETTRANADTALSNRATALESTVNDTAKGNAALVARIGAEETTRADANTALATRATNLESTVNTGANRNALLRSDITTEATTRTNADTALATRATTLESKVGSNGAVNANPTFASYTNATGTPDGWTTDNQVGTGATRVAGETGGYALQLVSTPNTSAYAAQTLGPIAANTWWVIEIDVKLTAGTFAGAGVLFRVGTQDIQVVFASEKDTTDTVVGAGTVGQTYRFRKLVQVTQTNAAPTFYYMNHWSALGSIAASNTIVWYRNAVRPASSAEIAAQRADTNAASALSKITTEETTRSNADTALSNRATALESTVNSGTDGNTALKSRISTEETTRANADTALATRTSSLESTSNSAPVSSINANPMFNAWPVTQAYPTGWSLWNLSGTVGRGASENNAPGTNSVLITANANAESGLQAPNLYTAAGWYVIDAEVYLNSGTYYGSGVTLGGSLNLDFARDPDTNDNISATGPARRKFSKLFKAPAYENISLHPMANWTGFGQRDAKSIYFNRCAIRPATDGEIKAQKADTALNTPGTGVIARITTEETTRANADTALSNRATALESTVNNGSTGVAATYAKVSTEETTRANADTALSNRATALESTVNNGTTGVAATYAKISTEETTRSNADVALANRATSLEARSSGGGNLIANTDFISSTPGVVADGWPGVSSANPVPTFGINIAGDPWHPSNENVLSIYQAGQAGTGGYSAFQSTRFAVQPGTYLNAYCYMASHRCLTQLILYWTDAAGTIVDASSSNQGGGTGAEQNGGQNLASWRQQGFTSVQVPANALGAVFELRKYNTNAGQADSYAWFVRPFATVTRAGTTDFVPFSPGSAKPSAMAAVARITTEETTRANADSALSSRTSTMENQINGTNDSYLRARIWGEETTRSNADTALSNRASSLESQINGTNDSYLRARIWNEETTRSNADSALATRATSLEATASGQTTSATFNDRFANWPNAGGMPAVWGNWQAGGNYRVERWAASMGSPYAIKTLNDTQNVESGFYQTIKAHAGKWVVEVTASCDANSMSGAGVTLHGQFSLDFISDPDTNGLTGDQGTRIRTWVKMFDISQAFIDSVGGNMNVHAMLGWEGFGRTRAPKYVTWYKLAVRPAGPGDIAGVKNAADIVSTNSRIGTEETTRANADTALANRTTVVEAQVATDGNNLLRNGIFNAPNWVARGAGGVPPYFAPWANDNGAFIGASPRDSRYGAPAPLQIDRNGINNGVTQGLPALPQGWYVFEVDITGEDGNWSGSGLHCNFNNGYSINFGFATNNDTGGRFGDIGTANRQFSTLFYNGAPSGGANLYLMAGWSGFQGDTNFGFFRTVWHRVVMRPATEGEIAARKVQDSNLIARVTTTESTLAQAGNLAAYWNISAQTPGASAFITAQAKTSNGVAVSNVSIGGTAINLVNTDGSGIRKGLSVENGTVTVYGNLRAGAAITLGSGNGWPVALASKDFNVSNGEYVAFGTTLDSLPNLTFAGNGLVALNSGETYRLYAENLTRDGFTARLEISVPSSPSNYDLSTGQYSGSGLRIIDKYPRPDSTSNTYNVTVSGTITATAYNNGDTYCIWTEAFTYTGKRGYELQSGDMLMVLEEDGTYAPQPIEEIGFNREDTVLLRSASGIELTVSKSTPVTLRDGTSIKAIEVRGLELPVLDGEDFRWEEIVAVEEAGVRPVARIYVGDRTFAAGNQLGRSIFTHNLPVNKN